MKRIHGRLLITTGVLHTLFALIPSVFGAQFVDFAASGFFAISHGIADFPLFGGTLDYETFAAFWFFYYGPLLILCGQAIDSLEQLGGGVPRYWAICFFVVVLAGAYMVPLSGMTFSGLPQAVFMLARSKPTITT